MNKTLCLAADGSNYSYNDKIFIFDYQTFYLYEREHMNCMILSSVTRHRRECIFQETTSLPAKKKKKPNDKSSYLLK